MDKQDIRNLSFEELCGVLASSGQPVFRARQIFEWIYKKGAEDFDAMKNLPSELRAELKDRFVLARPEVAQELVSGDKTRKMLFDLPDREKVETVLIPTPERATVCVSTQAGCKFGCRFCASGIGGWQRNLTSAEILSQILYAKKKAQDRPLSHIVFMGTGEPLDNYDNVFKAIRIINSAEGLNIAARRITVSTCGVIPQIRRMAKEGIQIELAISLHGYSDESRRVLMPVNKKYPMHDLIAACREYFQATKRQITFEYILIPGVTCTPEAAGALGQLLKGIVCKMNLIPYNPVKEFDHNPPTRTEISRFKQELLRHGVHATVRTPRGRDVNAACGQLRHAAGVAASS
ncbi:MAG: 23S rRNA (adenine(2503)-C(2))-methyltransferase RlmN [Candidatus Omnitrophota bacterium]|nr:23S rRNA (adenine(2503)-C(2))-methyltransferase RlmN [Candidatus Omnitrophota bacterium]MDZ4242297.1 23S rRNA (adenine(2503)-C(2))-methyltransferase RlmN [Candidatus Omnitrophota bacterium]